MPGHCAQHSTWHTGAQSLLLQPFSHFLGHLLAVYPLRLEQWVQMGVGNGLLPCTCSAGSLAQGGLFSPKHLTPLSLGPTITSCELDGEIWPRRRPPAGLGDSVSLLQAKPRVGDKEDREPGVPPRLTLWSRVPTPCALHLEELTRLSPQDGEKQM